MDPLIVLSAVEQVAEHLRREILRGGLSRLMPGVSSLVAQLGVNHKTVEAALRVLENEGLLVNRGRGLQRRIEEPKCHARPALRVGILLFSHSSLSMDYITELGHLLKAAGHIPFYAKKSLEDLGMNVERVARLAKKTKADAWIVCAASRKVLQWFVEFEKPTLALFGRRKSLPLAGVGPDHVKVSRLLIRRLIALGHQRIVTLARESQRVPEPSQAKRAIIEELNAHGISTGNYNLPAWKETPEGIHQILDELFRISPPTALIIDEPLIFHAAKDHLARKGIFAPDHVSLICSGPDPSFAWCRPSIAHLEWSSRPVLRRVISWMDNVAKGVNDQQQTLTKINFVEGESIGPALP